MLKVIFEIVFQSYFILSVYATASVVIQIYNMKDPLSAFVALGLIALCLVMPVKIVNPFTSGKN